MQVDIEKIEVREGAKGRGLYISARVSPPTVEEQERYNRLHVGLAELTQESEQPEK